MSREEETKRVIEYYFKNTSISSKDLHSKILAEIAVSLAMIVDILKKEKDNE